MGEIDKAFTTTTSASTGALSLETLQEAMKQVGPFPERATYMEINGKRYPVKDFSLSLEPPTLRIDEATGPDYTVLTTWQRERIVAMFEVKPAYLCNWAGLMADDGPGKLIPYTLRELRALRKRMRDHTGKRLLKEIARNPALCQQDPRKLKRIARHKAKQLQRLTGEKVTYTVHKAR